MNHIKHGIDRDNLDMNVRPQTDFYEYACGGWKKAHPIPAEHSRFGMFDLLREENRKRLQKLVEGLAENPDSKIKDTIAQKVSDLYAQGLDMERRNREGAAPLKAQLDKIASASRDDLAELVAWAHNGITSSFFSTGVGPDPKDSDINIMHAGEGGLGLGDRDYYLVESDTNKKILDAYKVYILRLMELIGYDADTASRVYENVMYIERTLALYKKTREERRDPTLSYNMRGYDDFKREFPFIDWDRYFAVLGVSDIKHINVGSLKYLKAMAEIMPGFSLESVKDYLTFQAVDGATGLLSDDFFNASFQMYDVTMSGIEEPEPLWKRALGIPGSMLGHAIGQLYVAEYFPEENKQYVSDLVENLRAALASHIDGLEWMGESTKRAAAEKLTALRVKIGYPDKWKDYSEIHVDPSLPYLENVYRASVWYVQDNYSKMGKPVDREEWFMHPQTVNAYYSPLTNEICFPAGILQPPYFDITADDAINYGAIGVVIGHEMTHGFDLSGNLKEWWSDEDAKRFNALADRLVDQFNAIEVAPGTFANGRYTLGENIADQGGLRVALSAYIRHLGYQENDDVLRRLNNADDIDDGFTPLQRFYMSYAILWAGNIRPEEILVRTQTDPHSLGRYRVNATLSNIDSFYEAFGVDTDWNLYRPESERTVIW